MPDHGYFFISYSRENSAYVTRLAAHLTSHGLPVWLDLQVPTGERWDTVLRERIETCAAVVLVMSPAAGRSEWVGKEIGHARLLGKKILPLLLAGEILFGLDQIQVESVVDGAMPSRAFVDGLRDILAHRRVLRYASGVVPEPADSFQVRKVAGQIDSATSVDGTAFLSGGSARVLSGLGGVGKTQLAAAVARRAHTNGEVDLLLWIPATSRADIITAYGRAGVHLIDGDPNDPESAAEAFLEYLAYTDETWMIVLDDLRDPSDLNHLWPPHTSTGRVIVTTRRTDASLRSHGSMVAVDLFSPAEARQYLVEKLAGDHSRLDESDELAEELGYLPLALAQAAAYIADRQISCAEYRRQFSDRHQRMSDLAPDSLPDDYTRPLAVALLLAVDAANALPPAGLARPLLVLLSLLDPHGIPTSLLTSLRLTHYLTLNQSPRPTTARIVYSDHAHDTLAVLARLSLATSIDGLARLHGLVQRCVREQAPPELLTHAARSAAGALVESWPEVESDPLLASALRANAAALRAHAEDQLWQPEPHMMLLRTGKSLIDAGLVAAAVSYWSDLVAQAEARLGPDHAASLALRHYLASAHEVAGHLDLAVSLYRAVAVDRERVLGRDHPDTLKSRNNLARAYRSEVDKHEGTAAGRPDEAVVLAEAAVADRERVLGPDHPYTLTSRVELARAYRVVDRLDDAIALLENTVRKFELLQSGEHRHTLNARNDLAAAYLSVRRFDEAIDLFEAVIAEDERVFGPHNPEALASRTNLAFAYASAGRLDDAIALCEATILRFEAAIPDHPYLFAIRNVLGNAYWTVGRFDEAIALHRANLADRERVLGPEDTDTLQSRLWLAWTYRHAGRLDEAVLQFEDALAHAEGALGFQSPSTRTISEKLTETRQLRRQSL